MVPRTKAKLRRLGSSFGFVVPSETVKQLGLKPGDEVILEIDRAGVEDAFGSMKDWVVNPQKLKHEVRKGW